MSVQAVGWMGDRLTTMLHSSSTHRSHCSALVSSDPISMLVEKSSLGFLDSFQALQKDVAETAISGTPTSKYDICRGLRMLEPDFDSRYCKGEDDFNRKVCPNLGIKRIIDVIVTVPFAFVWGETLGKGTYGEVVKAKDKRTRRPNTVICQKFWKCDCVQHMIYGCDVVTGRCEPLRSSTKKRCSNFEMVEVVLFQVVSRCYFMRFLNLGYETIIWEAETESWSIQRNIVI